MLKNKLIFIIFALFVFNCLPDEKNWQEQRFEGISLGRVRQIDNQFIIMGNYDVYDSATYSYITKVLFLTSTDGQNWQRTDTDIQASYFMYYSGKYILMRTDENESILYESEDRVTWSEIALPYQLNHLVYNESSYLGLITSNSGFTRQVTKSTDLVNWSAPETIDLDIQLQGIWVLNYKYYATGFYDNIFMTKSVFSSNDGVHWSEISNFSGIDISVMRYISGELVFTGTNGTIFKKENDKWVNHSVLFGPNFGAVARGRNEFVFAGGYYGKPNPVLWSTSDFFIWKVSQHDIRTKNPSFIDEYDAWYNGVFYTGDFYIVTANECLNGECEGIILTAE